MSISSRTNTVSIDSINQSDDWEQVDRLHYKGFTDFLQSLLDMKVLEGAAEGISKQILAKGLNSLTTPQREAFQKHVLDVYTMVECPDCNHEPTWEEMYWAVSDECPQCEHNRERMLEA